LVDSPREHQLGKWQFQQHGHHQFDIDFDQSRINSGDELGRPDGDVVDHFDLDRRDLQSSDDDNNRRDVQPAFVEFLHGAKHNGLVFDTIHVVNVNRRYVQLVGQPNDDVDDIPNCGELESIFYKHAVRQLERGTGHDDRDAIFFELDSHVIEHTDERDGIESRIVRLDLDSDRIDE
jgi:hypothetical protein